MQVLTIEQRQQKKYLLSLAQKAAMLYNEQVDQYLLKLNPTDNPLYDGVNEALENLNHELKKLNTIFAECHVPVSEAQQNLNEAVDELTAFTEEVFQEIDDHITDNVETPGWLDQNPHIEGWREQWSISFILPDPIDVINIPPLSQDDLLNQSGDPIDVVLEGVEKVTPLFENLDLPDSAKK